MDKEELGKKVDEAKLSAENDWERVNKDNSYLNRMPKEMSEPFKELFVKGYLLGYIKRLDEEEK